MRLPVLFGQGRQMRDASIQIPCVTSIAEDFKHAVAKDQQTRTCRDLARLSWKFTP